MQRYFLLIILVGLFLFVGCSREKNRFTVWIGGAPQEVDYLAKLIHEFEQNTGRSVLLVRQPTDSDQRRQGLVISLESKQPDPDVFLMDAVWVGQFALSGWLEPFDAYREKSGFSTRPFFERIVRLVDVYNNSVFALPIYVDGGLLYYRSDLLEKYGYPAVPERWEDLVKIAENIQEKERRSNPNFNGFVWQGAQYEGLVCNFLEFTASNRGGIMIDRQFELNNAQNIPALQFMQDLIHKYRISPLNTYTDMKEEQVRRSFQQGNALFERNWPYAWKLAQSEDSPVRGKVGIAPLPHFDGGESASTLGGWHIGISRFSDMKEQAWQFVEFVTSYEAQKKLVLNLGWNPGRRDVYRDEEVLKRLPHLHRLQAVFEHAVARPNVPYYTQVSDTIQRFANNCLAGKIKPREALDEMQKDIHKVTRWYEKE
jgi:multiple sugar transport system substrate-binding protein